MTSLGLLAIAAALVGLSGFPGLALRAGRAAGQRVATVLHLAGCAAGTLASAWALAGAAQAARFAWSLPCGAVTSRSTGSRRFSSSPSSSSRASARCTARATGPSRDTRRTGAGCGSSTASRPPASCSCWPPATRGASSSAGRSSRLAAFFLITTDETDASGVARGVDLPRVRPRGNARPLRDVRAAARRDRGLAPPSSRGPGVVGPARSDPRTRARRLRPQGGRDSVAHLAAGRARRRAEPVSAVLSGLVLKMGIYGLLRIFSFLPAGPGWLGLVLLGLGTPPGSSAWSSRSPSTTSSGCSHITASRTSGSSCSGSASAARMAQDGLDRAVLGFAARCCTSGTTPRSRRSSSAAGP